MPTTGPAATAREYGCSYATLQARYNKNTLNWIRCFDAVGEPSTPARRTPDIPTPPIPGILGGGDGGRGTAFEVREDEVFSSGILTGDEAFDLFFNDDSN